MNNEQFTTFLSKKLNTKVLWVALGLAEMNTIYTRVQLPEKYEFTGQQLTQLTELFKANSATVRNNRYGVETDFHNFSYLDFVSPDGV